MVVSDSESDSESDADPGVEEESSGASKLSGLEWGVGVTPYNDDRKEARKGETN